MLTDLFSLGGLFFHYIPRDILLRIVLLVSIFFSSVVIILGWFGVHGRFYACDTVQSRERRTGREQQPARSDVT